MAFEVPTDLIRQVQAAVRKDAGLSSYDPYDPTLPPLPSFAASIAGLDPSPPSLRCNHCKGRLLSGIHSLICVYCGKQQKRDVPPEPIAFNSSFGYRLLLESLGLNGSETIGPDLEESETNRGQSTPKDEISLSKLLDLHIPWLDEPEKIETSVSESSVTLTGVDLDNYFQEPNSDSVFNAFQDQLVTKQIESTESKEITGQDNLNLFQNVPEASRDDFSGWEASFQSADAETQHESSKSADPFISSTVNLTAHIDSVFGGGENLKAGEQNDDPVPADNQNQLESSKSADPFVSATVDLMAHIDSVFGGGENLKDGKPNDDPVPAPSMASNWTGDDLWNNVSTAVAQSLDSAAKDEDGRSLDIVNDPSSDNLDWFQDNQWQNNIGNVVVDKNVNCAASQPFDSAVKDNSLNNPSSESVDWFQDNQWQTNITSVPNYKAVTEDEDSFDEWNDFTSSSNAQAPSSTAAVYDQMSDKNMFNSPGNFQEVDFGSFSQVGVFSEGPNSDRNGDSKSKAAENFNDFGTILQPKDDVEMLMSEMHDLSFMLENNLSVPPKLEAVGSFSHD